MTSIGTLAPTWTATAYANGEAKTVSSSDYRGRWYVLYFYPIDFSFVCPTEIRGFQALLDDFEREGVSVIGASTDSFYSHRAWLRDAKTFPYPITHPILADTSHALSRAFGVLKEDEGIAYRATVIVDPERSVRSIGVNELHAGRSPVEVLRTVQALQSGGLCGADWKKGDAYAA